MSAESVSRRVKELSPFSSPPRVFISYARSDGADFAAALRTRIQSENPEITLWMDRAQMVGGVGWWKQITDALEEVETLIMVLTPAAAQSEVAAKEWRYARQQGVRVCPVMEHDSALDFSELPSWMRKVHCYDLSKEWDSFIAYMLSAEKVSRVPFMAPDLPAHCIPRQRELDEILSFVLDATRENPAAVTAALQGSGGFGKTTLACMLCHDEHIISAFDDGVLWASLGETPDLQGELRKLYAALTGERLAFIDVDDASIQLAAQLDQKNCLVVIDDVWDSNHLRPFMRGGAHCSRLITTRQLSVLTDVETTRTMVDKMTSEQALQMLSARIEAKPSDAAKLARLAERLGEWPLLLKLASSQLKARMDRGDSLQGALSYIDRALDKKGIVAFDRVTPTARHDAVTSTVGASLELFDEQDRVRCAQLSVFRKDVPVPVTAATALWGLDDFDTEDLVLRLDNAALLEFDLKTGKFRLHNVLRSYFESLADDVAELHQRLAESWLEVPSELPGEYEWTWIGWHLKQAGMSDRLQDLLFDFDWLQERLKFVSVQTLLHDFDRIGESKDARTVRDALRLASYGLAYDPMQLRTQLCGRIDRGRSQEMDRFLDAADEGGPGFRIDLAETSLTHPGGALAGILKSHTGPVRALAISVDGRWLVSGSEDWMLHLWDLNDGRVVRNFQGHGGAIHSVAFSRDGKFILSGSEDRTLRLWRVASGEEVSAFRGHTLAVQGVAMSADGSVAASVSEDGSVRTWDLNTKETKVVFKGREHQLNAIAMTADGGTLAFGAGDWTLRVVELDGSANERVLGGHAGVVRCAAFSPDGSLLLSGSDDCTLHAWSTATGELQKKMAGHEAPVDAVVLTLDGKMAVSGSRDKSLRLWDLGDGKARGVFRGHAGIVRSVVVSPSSGQVVSGSTDKTIRFWNLGSDTRDEKGASHSEPVSLLTASADGSVVVSGTKSDDPAVWEPADNNGPPRIIRHLRGHKDRVHALELSSGGRQAVTASRDRTLRIWNLANGACTQILQGHSREVLDLDISEDGSRVLSFSRDRTVRVWDSSTGRNLRVLVSDENKRALSSFRAGDAMLEESQAGPVLDITAKPIARDPIIAIAPNGNRVVIGSQGNVSFWDLESGNTEDHDLGESDIIVVDYSPNSELAVLGSLFGSLFVSDFTAPPKVLEGHTGPVLDIVVGEDGIHAISAGKDNTFRTWNVVTGEQVSVVSGESGTVDEVAISPNGRLACSIYGDTLVVYGFGPGDKRASISFDHEITAVSVTPLGDRVVIGDQSGRVHHLSLAGWV
ncbi:MAG: NB-ARC domain-containing protein [Woeseiaceae bacterium]|nr:NB-ARC domain-containing protein [Woeseiaceae bacterium]